MNISTHLTPVCNPKGQQSGLDGYILKQTSVFLVSLSHLYSFFATIKSHSRYYLIISLLSLTSFILFISFFTYLYFSKDLDSKASIMQHNDTGIVLLDKYDKPFFSFGRAKVKTFVPLKIIPLYMQEAVIATEDQDFYHHPGFSPKAIIRAFIDDITSQKWKYGASTLTQQLVKNTLLTPEKKFLRKFQEILLAFNIEKKYSKDEILEMYLNTAYFGQGAYGVESASQVYFGKKSKDLTLQESALLASVLPAPSYYNPFKQESEIVKKRLASVLTKMSEEKYITQKDKEEAVAKDITLTEKGKTINSNAPHFALMVRDFLLKKYGRDVYTKGYKIHTTLDIDFQQFSEEVTLRHIEDLKKHGAGNGAMVVLSPNGAIEAFVGSYSWADEQNGKVNMAIVPRQPGSSFKPIVYARAFEKEIITPATFLKDNPITYKTSVGDYKPNNYDRNFRGSVTVRRALSNSLNIPSVEVMSRLGVEDVLETAKSFGITTLKNPSDYGLSLVLGSGEVSLLELTQVYSVFANEGILNEAYFLEKIIDKKDNVIYSHLPERKKVISPQVAFLISTILSDNVTRREIFGKALDNKVNAAVKTGTTNSYKDAWTIGYTPSVTVGVWVGNNDNKPMDGIAGSLGAAPIWREIIEKYQEDNKNEEFTVPASIVQKSVCNSARTEYFLPGTENQVVCYQKPIATSDKKSPEAESEENKKESPPPKLCNLLNLKKK